MIEYGPGNTPLDRFSVKKLWNTVLKALNLEKGILYTMINLTIRPGATLRMYLFEDRSKLVKPLSFLLLTTAIAAFLTLNLLELEGMFKSLEVANQSTTGNTPKMDAETKATLDKINQQYIQSFNLILLVSVPFLALSSFLFYQKAKYNFAEHLVVAAYLTGIMNSFYSLLFPLFRLDYFMVSSIFMLLFMIYATFVYIQLFQERIWLGVLKGIGIQVFYYTIFFIFMMLFVIVAVVIIIVMKGGL